VQVSDFSTLEVNQFLEKSLKLNWEGMNYICGKLTKLNVENISFIANFVTIIWSSPEQAQSIANKLFAEGIIVRSLSSFGLPHPYEYPLG
jgi:histidinol-phosphate/aromatic aminotransferase/cobyric acid decarboxylase-like protein